MRGVLFAAVLVAVGCGKGEPTTGSDSTTVQRSDPPKVAPKAEPAPSVPSVDCKPGGSADVGDVTVTVDRVTVNQFLLWNESGGARSHPAALMVQLSIKNRNPNRLIELSSQVGKAYATDDVGNTYRTIEVVGKVQPDGRRDPAIGPRTVRSLRSDRDTADTVIITAPVPGASKLTIHLDASAYGGAGTIRTTVLKTYWQPKAP